MKMSDSKLMRMVELARGHVERGEGVTAEVLYRMVMKDASPPKSGVQRLAMGEACVWYANRALAEGLHGQAIDWFQRAVVADPRCVEYRVQYCARALMPMGLHKTARIEAERATKIDPTFADAWTALGDIEQTLGNARAAIAAYEKRLELDPSDPNARIDRAAIAINLADYEKATEMVTPVLETESKAAALHALGMIAYREANHEKAIDLYTQAIDAGFHDEAQVRWNRSLAYHAIGRYLEGWKDHEYRGKQRGDKSMALLMNRFVAPAFKLEDEPCRLHVHQEMGHGDTIAMVRYLDHLVDLGHDVRLEVNETMVDLLRMSFPKVTVMPKAIDYPSALGVPPFDRHLPMLSLPHIFKTEVDSIPWSGPYIKPIFETALMYDKRLTRASKGNGGLRVGVCWSSGIRDDGLWIAEYGRRKSMHFSELGPILKLKGDFVSLQVGPERLQADDSVIDLLPEKPTWHDTAALIENLDLVITVDTAVAHLAGAMGKPTWVIMQNDGASWHFMCERPGAAWNERSPWYPLARIFRQKRCGDWTNPIAAAGAELKNSKF